MEADRQCSVCRVQEVGSQGKKARICALVCAPKLIWDLKLVCALVCAVVCAPKLVCALICGVVQQKKKKKKIIEICITVGPLLMKLYTTQPSILTLVTWYRRVGLPSTKLRR